MSNAVIKLLETPVEGGLRASIQALLEEGETQARIAREAGISGSALSRWLKGEYEGDSVAVEGKIETWLVSRRQRAQTALPVSPDWIETPTAGKILITLSFAQMAGDLAVVYGAAGVGKTVSLRRYAATSPSTWAATVSPAISGCKAVLEEIAEAVGMRELPGWTSRLRRELLRRMRDTRGLLIVDECQHLSVAALEELRALHDACGIGLALAGNETVYHRLRGGSRAAEFAQLFSRIGKRLYLAGALADDVKAVADAWRVHGKAERDFLGSIAKTPGSLRAVTKTLRLAAILAGAEGSPVDTRYLRAAWRDLGGESDANR